MKKLILLLMLLPLLSFAQDAQEKVKPHHPKNEIGLNAGVIIYADNKLSRRSPSAQFGAAYFRNFKQTQLGLVVNYNEDDWGFQCMTPTVVLNRKFNFGNSYLYAGGAVGYYYARLQMNAFSKLNGYTAGLQVGYVLNLNKNFAVSSEVAIRSAQYWHRVDMAPYYMPRYLTDFSLTFPATIAIRYRFK